MKIDLMADLDWSEADIETRCRAEVASAVTEARQNELRTIMLGHLSGMRTASASELAEVALVKGLVEQAGQDLIQARADMALLRETWAYEQAQQTLLVTPDDAQAQGVIAGTSQAAIDLATSRAAARAPA
jgi:hypothetical protein